MLFHFIVPLKFKNVVAFAWLSLNSLKVKRLAMARKICLILILWMALTPHASAQSAYSDRALKLLHSISTDSLAAFQFPFSDTMRTRWERLPGQRMGYKLSHFTEVQKIALHELMRSCLSTQGYLTVTSLMFNEDIQQKFEPNLGRNEYWAEIFGNPSDSAYWGWKLEGHHLSLNFTFHGNAMLSNSPFLVSTNPSNSITDTARAGMILLYKEEELGRQVVNSFTPDQLKIGYNPRKKTATVYSEQDKTAIHVPDEGIYYRNLNIPQQAIAQALITEYFANFNPGEVPTVAAFCNRNLRFFYVESREKGSPHYYRFENGKQIIEYENSGNHIHCFWRTENDFGRLATTSLPHHGN